MKNVYIRVASKKSYAGKVIKHDFNNYADALNYYNMMLRIIKNLYESDKIAHYAMELY